MGHRKIAQILRASFGNEQAGNGFAARMGRRSIKLGCVIAVLLGAHVPAAAAGDDQAIAGASQAIADALIPISFARSLIAVCAARDPAGAADRAAVHDGWRRSNGVDGFEAAMAAVQARSRPLAVSRGRLESASAREAAKAVAEDPATCGRLASVLSAPRFRIAAVTAQGARVLQSLAPRRDPAARPRPQRHEPAAAPLPRRQDSAVSGNAVASVFAPSGTFGYVPGRSGSTRSSAG